MEALRIHEVSITSRTPWLSTLQLAASAEAAERLIERSMAMGADGAHTSSARLRCLYLGLPEGAAAPPRSKQNSRRLRIRWEVGGCEADLIQQSRRREMERERVMRVPLAEVEMLGAGSQHPVWDGAWFAQRVHAMRVVPVILAEFHRTKVHATLNGAQADLVVDTDVQAAAANAWTLDHSLEHLDVPQGCLLKMSFEGALPSAWKEIIRDLGLAPARAGKFRMALEAAGRKAGFPNA